jgi:hypothetical protein
MQMNSVHCFITGSDSQPDCFFLTMLAVLWKWSKRLHTVDFFRFRNWGNTRLCYLCHSTYELWHEVMFHNKHMFHLWQNHVFVLHRSQPDWHIKLTSQCHKHSTAYRTKCKCYHTYRHVYILCALLQENSYPSNGLHDFWLALYFHL